MRIGVFADIHAILATWNAVYRHMQKHELNGYWCLGDIVGRGFNPIGVTRVLMGLYNLQGEDNQTCRHNLAWVRGNHDQNISNGEIQQIGDRLIHYKPGHNGVGGRMNERDLKWDYHNLNQLAKHNDLLDWLRRMPAYALDILDNFFTGVHIIHGRFVYRDGQVQDDDCVWTYCKTDDDIRQQINDLSAYTNSQPRVILNAHTHIPLLALYDANSNDITHVPKANLFQGHTFDLQPHQTLIINPGSVSFPRHISPLRPTYVVMEFDPPSTVRVSFQQVSVPCQHLQIPADYDDHYKGELHQLCSQSSDS